MGFTKLDERILQSSIMAEDPSVFKCWIVLLASCKSNGIACISPVFISSICHLPQEIVDSAIEKLSSPDKHSRSINDEGRRIRRVDGGFEIINYKKYREFTYSDNQEAVKKRKQRENKRDITGHSGTCPGHSASASASASASEEEKEVKEKRKGMELAEPPKTWRNDYDTYLQECNDGFDACIDNWAWVAERKHYHPRLNVRETARKAFFDFWGTQAGWKHKKASRAKECDWERTVNNALTLKLNQVWINGDRDDEADYIKTMERRNASTKI